MRSHTIAWLIFLALHLPLFAQVVEPRFPPPRPVYKVRVERSVMVPMRDHVRLSTDLYFPEGVAGKLPTVLIRTPYDKKHFYRNEDAEPYWVGPYIFAGQGYVVAVQDVRAKFESEGQAFVMNAAEPQDGYDTVSWLAAQPWSNGKVGTYGCSYLGEAQYEQAKLRNPHLAAMIPQGAGPVKYHNFGVYTGGVFELAAAFGWFRENGNSFHPHLPLDIPPAEFRETAKYFNLNPIVPRTTYAKFWSLLPVVDMMDKAQAPPSDWKDIVSHEAGDTWWEQLGLIQDTDRFDVPALHINSWYDWGAAETLQLFNLLRTNAETARGRDNQFIVLSPTTHCVSETSSSNTVVGSRNVGDAQFDYWGLYLRWFDHWLKGDDNGVTKRPKVQFYVMGKGEWRSDNEWPPARTKYTNYYLHSGGHANSRFGDGTLSTMEPGREAPDRFTYDPATPVPSVGGPECCTGTEEQPAGAFDQSNVEMRNDVLVYTTPALSSGIEVTGPLQVVLYVSSSARDTDFTGKVVDVYPDGTAYNVQEGILRSRYRDGYENKVWMKPQSVYKLVIGLEATSNYFGAGHRIRLEISSSNFPRFERNLNTGGNNFAETSFQSAMNTIHHSKVYASHIVVPVVP